MTPPIRAILFDKDGTLFDFRATWDAWAAGLVSRLSGGDASLARAIGAAMGFDTEAGRFDPDSPVIAGTPGEVVAALHPLVGGDPEMLERTLNEEAANAPQVEVVPLAPLLGRLRGAGLALGVATNDAEAPARAHLGVAGVTGLFDFIAGWDSGHGAKPGPGQCLAFARSRGLDPASVVMVGDSLHDLHAGQAAGMRRVAVLTGPAGADTLAPHADAVLDNIGALPGWLGLD